MNDNKSTSIDYTGQKIGKWTIVQRISSSDYKVVCDCGLEAIKSIFIIRPNSQCMTCYRRDAKIKRSERRASMY